MTLKTDRKGFNNLMSGLTALVMGFNVYFNSSCALFKNNPSLERKPIGISEQYVPPLPPAIAEVEAEQEEHKSTWDIYGENIIYRDLSKIDFDSLPDEKIRIPSDLENALEKPKVKDQALLEKIVFGDASEFGYKIDDIGKLPAKEAIDLAV